MSISFANAVQETANAGGTVDFVLPGTAVDTGFWSVTSSFNDGDQVHYEAIPEVQYD